MDPKNPPPRISAAGLLGPDLVFHFSEKDFSQKAIAGNTTVDQRYIAVANEPWNE